MVLPVSSFSYSTPFLRNSKMIEATSSSSFFWVWCICILLTCLLPWCRPVLEYFQFAPAPFERIRLMEYSCRELVVVSSLILINLVSCFYFCSAVKSCFCCLRIFRDFLLILLSLLLLVFFLSLLFPLFPS